ncbi:protein SpAN-like [Glandiceps talaboti]
MDFHISVALILAVCLIEETTAFPHELVQRTLNGFKKRPATITPKLDPTSVEAADTPGTVEGDMMMNLLQKDIYERHLVDPNGILDNEIKEKRKAINVNRYNIWPSAIIPYYFDTLLPEMQPRVEYAMKIWEEKTCLHFVPYPSNETNHSGRVAIIEGNGCWSNMAFTGGLQKISLEKANCNSLSVILHEIGHTVGLFHEQSRPDRDRYITIHLENVKQGMGHNFKRRDFSETDTLDMPYDVSSVMHYGPKAFSKDGSITLESTDPEKQQSMGKQQLLTFLDYKIVNEMYGCGQKCSNAVECLYGGYVGPDCQCVCPRGLGGDNCETVVLSSGCGGKLKDVSGQFSTPNYPNHYENHSQCSWFIEAPKGYRVIVTFEDFQLEPAKSCAFDRILVRNDEPFYDGYPTRYCGVTLKGKTLASLHNTLFIEFASDYSVTRPGFKASYSFIAA